MPGMHRPERQDAVAVEAADAAVEVADAAQPEQRPGRAQDSTGLPR